MAPSRIFWAVFQAETHYGAKLTWGFIAATVNLSVQTTQNPELMAKIDPKTCKTAQNYMSEVDSKCQPVQDWPSAQGPLFRELPGQLAGETVMRRRAWL